MDELTYQSEEMTVEPQDYLPQEQAENPAASQEKTFTPESGNNPVESPQTTTEQPQTIRIKYNHKEYEIPIAEAVTHIQKGLNYEKAIERARQEGRASFAAEWEETRSDSNQRQTENEEFIGWYREKYGKELDPHSIPDEVWKAVKQGIPLRFAYIEHAFNVYRAKETEAAKTAQITHQTQQTNAKLANTSTGAAKNNQKQLPEDPMLKGFDSYK